MQAEQSIVVDPRSPGGINSPHGLILFDGVCVLCSRGCRFVNKRDRRGYFRFVPIQLAEGRPLAEQLGIDPDHPDSFAFLASGQASFQYLRINSRLRSLRRIPRQSPLRLLGITGDRECCAPACSREASCPNLNASPSVIPFAAIERPACPKCKAQMMLVSIEPARARGVDLQTFECAVCNQVLTNFAAFEDPMKSKGLGRWLQGDLHPPK